MYTTVINATVNVGKLLVGSESAVAREELECGRTDDNGGRRISKNTFTSPVSDIPWQGE